MRHPPEILKDFTVEEKLSFIILWEEKSTNCSTLKPIREPQSHETSMNYTP